MIRRTTVALASLAALLAISSTATAAPKADDTSRAAPSQVLVGLRARQLLGRARAGGEKGVGRAQGEALPW
jgi:hypothetical protein